MNILITGIASGIGRATADLFLARGHTVFGIDRAPAAEQKNLHGFMADITREEELLSVARQLSDREIRLDAIVNIAGIHIMTSLVEGDWARMQKIVDVNLSGTMLVNRVFHPFLREKGRILIVTSEVAGFDPVPFNGLYSVTKTALEAYAQALRQELNLLGQKVVTVRPGAVETPLSTGSVQATQSLADTTVLYQDQARRFVRIANAFMGKPISPEKLAVLIYKAATAKHPHLTYKKNANPGLVLLSWLPKSWQCAIIKWLLNSKLL
jgi:NAD(P)-dependent dehydrogenase (short-subunit alcohol dehydrogenase family)